MTDVSSCRPPSVGHNGGPPLLSGYLDREALAAELRVCGKTIARYEAQPNGLPSIKLGGRKLYRVDAVLRWLEARETRPNPRRV
jgi:hypothetical protein